MIFLTVGSEIGFDRLTQAVDQWAARHPDREVFMQIADGAYIPRHARWERFLSSSQFESMLAGAALVVGHAGTGTIISCKLRGLPVLLIPRRADFRETRNDHQLATCRRFESVPGVSIAWSEGELEQAMMQAMVREGERRRGEMMPPEARLIDRIGTFLTEAVPRNDRMLCVCSGGGHWLELQRLIPAFGGWDVHVAATKIDSPGMAEIKWFASLPDATRWDRMGLLKLAARVGCMMARLRPGVVLSTGAAPGYFALRFGEMLGARTVWIDSFANADELSLSGKKVGRFADLWLTQWPELARAGGPEYAGSVLPIFDEGSLVGGAVSDNPGAESS